MTDQEQMENLGPWFQIIDLGAAGKTPGLWPSEAQAEFLVNEAPWAFSGRILDAGANGGAYLLHCRTMRQRLWP